MNIISDLTLVNFNKLSNRVIKYIVIHYTGNQTDTAKGNANYFRGVNRGASAHYFVDQTSIYQVVEDKNVAWAVGRNYGRNNLFGIVTNNNSISIEMCSNGGKIEAETIKNTLELTKYLMKKYSIPAANVYRHWDVCSKICPGWYGWGANGTDASIWNKFKSSLVEVIHKSNPHNEDKYYVDAIGNKMYSFEVLKETDVKVAPNDLADTVTRLPKGSKQGIIQITVDNWGLLGNKAGWVHLIDFKPLENVTYELKNTHCYVRENTTKSKVVTDLKKGSKQPICFVSNDNRGLISNYAGWVKLKNFDKLDN